MTRASRPGRRTGAASRSSPPPTIRREVLFARLDARFRATLWVRPLEGGNPRRLGSGSAARWSPDGDRIVFIDDRDRNGRCLFHDCVGSAPELYVIDGDGGGATRLTRTRASEGSPSFTPDGDHVVFSRIADEDDDHDLVLVALDGSCERALTDTRVWELFPDWIGGGARC
jgi:Tol biopolymer transport system component